MTDIAALKDLAIAADTAELLLRQWCPDEASSLRQKVSAANAALSRLTTPPPPEPKGCPAPGACSCIAPLPEEIAGLIEQAYEAIRGEDHFVDDTLTALSAVLRALAQENERLKNPTPYRTELRRNQKLEECIRELEAERDALKDELCSLKNAYYGDAYYGD